MPNGNKKILSDFLVQSMKLNTFSYDCSTQLHKWATLDKNKLLLVHLSCCYGDCFVSLILVQVLVTEIFILA